MYDDGVAGRWLRYPVPWYLPEVSPMAVATVETHRWTREEYERLAAKGFFPPGKRVELVEGVIYDMAPQNSPHATALHVSQEVLRTLFPPGSGYAVRCQSPLTLGEDSEPEPGLVVVPGSFRDYGDHHPTTALLVMEIADSSLFHDRKRKIPLYARHGIPESWLLNLIRGTLEVYRDPSSAGYQTRTVLRTGDSLSPLSRPDRSVRVAELLP
jgi:Uma2 family endonuclease